MTTETTLPAPDAPPPPDPIALPISTVERETGLGKDTLRVWEKRYGFPAPTRDTYGDRLYSTEQVQQLKLIRRLLDGGMRPGKVVGRGTAELQALLARNGTPTVSDLSRTNSRSGHMDATVEGLLATIGSHDPQALRHALGTAQMRMGLAPFVAELVAPLTIAVGEAWAQGRFEVFEEHLYTEVLTGVLRHAIASLTPQPVLQRPKVLLTTLPQEQHGLGLLMVEALLALEGCSCVSLGTQTPVTDIVAAAQAHRADVVALSFSNVHKAAAVRASLRELRTLLPAATALWVGGSCHALHQMPLAGVSAVQHLAGLPPLVAQWRHAH